MTIARLLTALLVTQTLAGQTGPRRGSFEAKFEKSHPAGSFREITKRLRWRKGLIQKHDPKASYSVAEESFFVHVPKSYVADGSFGVLVWISPAPQGNCGADWPDVLAKHKLIYVGPHKAGNDRFVWYRVALALDAVHNIAARYRIDPERVYVVGHSGGGRLASTLGMHWADVFRGGIYCCGVNHFRKIKKPKQEFFWPAKFPKPIGKILGYAQRRSRHVILNGEKDFNLVHSRLVAEDLQRRQRFRRVSMLVMKGRGHAHPNAEWLDRSVQKLDAPLLAERKKKAAAKKRQK